MKKYKAVFFDWDGTAVVSRKAPVDTAAAAMKKLLSKDVKSVVVSGTTLENIGEGRLHEFFDKEERKNLFYGLGRGAYNYHFQENGEIEIFKDCIPDAEGLLKIHRVCYEIHEELLKKYGFPTDIVFSRPNYCKIDIMVERNRGEQLFFQGDEPEMLKASLKEHGIADGINGLIKLSEELGEKHGISLCATCDAKYLEVGLSSKSTNVDIILDYLKETEGISPEECAYWGDEYIGLEEGLYGSDSFMITPKTQAGDFFDVSEAKGPRPEGVTVLGGGIETFLAFLKEQAEM